MKDLQFRCASLFGKRELCLHGLCQSLLLFIGFGHAHRVQEFLPARVAVAVNKKRVVLCAQQAGIALLARSLATASL
jgi:hypothetical protein